MLLLAVLSCFATLVTAQAPTFSAPPAIQDLNGAGEVQQIIAGAGAVASDFSAIDSYISSWYECEYASHLTVSSTDQCRTAASLTSTTKDPLDTSCASLYLYNNMCNSQAGGKFYQEASTLQASCACYSLPDGVPSTAAGYWVPDWYDSNIQACVSYFGNIWDTADSSAANQAQGFCSGVGDVRQWPSAFASEFTQAATVTSSAAASAAATPASASAMMTSTRSVGSGTPSTASATASTSGSSPGAGRIGRQNWEVRFSRPVALVYSLTCYV